MTEFEKVFSENNELVFRYLMKLTKNISLAQELTQETFFRAYMNYSGLRNKDKVSLWLCQIAKNAYFAKYNEEKKFADFEECKITDRYDDAEEELIKKETAGRILNCLHELEEPYKEVFMLCVFGEFSLKDISKVFGKSESWARVTFYRAKQKISERMREENEV